MTTRFALILFALVAAAAAADAVWNGGAAGVFLARKLVDLIEYLSVWR
jgi:hypothetical protein